MNLFKKKYKRSKWFEGLLWAEKIVKDSGIANLELYIKSGTHDPMNFDSDLGAEDYFYYYENILRRA